MSVITVKKFNEAYLQITTDDFGIYYELFDHFSFEVPNSRFQAKVKAGVWDGIIRLFNQKNRTLYAGLFEDLVEFCKSRSYTIELKESPAYGFPDQKTNILPEDIVEFSNWLNVHSRGEKLSYRDYQLHAIYSSLKNKRQTVLSSTGSGKSLIIYTITRWLLQDDAKVLIIVPTTQLCYQMLNDFKDYSSENGYDAEADAHIIMGGKSKVTEKGVTISTWQSLSQNRVSPEWLNQFDAILCDEVHTAKATEITKLLERATDVQYRFGFTGSLDKSSANKTVIKGLFGQIIKVSSTKKLIEEGHLSDIKIKCVVIDHSKEDKALFTGKIDYQNELQFIVGHEKRNRFIRNLATSIEGNTLILYTLVEKHGQVLYDMIKARTDRDVYFIHGGVSAEDRDKIREIVENSNNAIIIASAGTFSTGTNLKRLHNVIFASPTKSVIRVLQSIGRGLRKAAGKDYFTLYDIGDKLTKSKTKTNHTYKHLVERLKIYVEEGFDYSITEVDFG